MYKKSRENIILSSSRGIDRDIHYHHFYLNIALQVLANEEKKRNKRNEIKNKEVKYIKIKKAELTLIICRQNYCMY